MNFSCCGFGASVSSWNYETRCENGRVAAVVRGDVQPDFNGKAAGSACWDSSPDRPPFRARQLAVSWQAQGLTP
eukprot:1244942-Rhodomonas_salina.1